MKLIAEAWKRFLIEANQVNVWPENSNYKDRIYLGGDNFPVQGQIIKINPKTLGNKTESSITFLKSENKNSFVVEVAGRTFGSRDEPELKNRGKNQIVISGKITSRDENSINTVFSIASEGIYEWKIENLKNSSNFKDIETGFDKIKNQFNPLITFDEIKNQINPLIMSLEDILMVLYRDFGDISLVEGSDIYSGEYQSVNNRYELYDYENADKLISRVNALNDKLSRNYNLSGGQLRDIKIGGMIDKKDQAKERQGPLKEVNSFEDLFTKFPIDKAKLEGKTGNWGCMDLAASLYSIITNKENNMSYTAEQFRKQTNAMSSIFGSSSSDDIANYIENNLGLEYRRTKFGTNNADQNFLMALYYLTREGLKDSRVCVNLKGTALILQGNLNTVRANPGSVDSATERSRRLGRGNS